MGIFNTFVSTMNKVYENRARVMEQRITSNNTNIYRKSSNNQEIDSFKREISPHKQIKYIKANNINEAVNYSKKAFGINISNIDDLELLNQINYTCKKAYNKSAGKTTFVNEIQFADIPENQKDGFTVCPAQLQMYHRNINGKETLTRTVLQLNRDLFKNPDKYVNTYLDMFKKNGQLINDKNGNDAINLICEYRYSNSLNRYYRLYKQGKLSTKAKVDFQAMLCKAREEEDLVLSKRNGLNNLFKKEYLKDFSELNDADFRATARHLLLDLKKNKNKVLLPHCKSTKLHSASGIDGYILHELGHRQHLEAIGLEEFLNLQKYHPKYDGNKDEIQTALLVSRYATENANEGVADIYAGIISNDKYPDNVLSLFGKYGKFVVK